VRCALLGCVEVQGDGVDAVAQAGGRRAVLEDVAEMGAAAAAQDFRSPHAVACVMLRIHDSFGDGLVEAGPAGAGVEFGVGIEQRLAAAHAFEHAFSLVVVVLSAEWAFGALQPRDDILLVGEHLPPFFIRSCYTFAHSQILRTETK
jgi:hypothetical protein